VAGPNRFVACFLVLIDSLCLSSHSVACLVDAEVIYSCVCLATQHQVNFVAHWDVGVVLGGTDFVGPTMAPQVAY
jgi:hypothetical protein